MRAQGPQTSSSAVSVAGSASALDRAGSGALNPKILARGVSGRRPDDAALGRQGSGGLPAAPLTLQGSGAARPTFDG